MFERGSFSFLALLVINPLVILLYQNCSFVPAAHSEMAAHELSSPKRAISSIGSPEKVEWNVERVKIPSIADCQQKVGSCPLSTIE